MMTRSGLCYGPIPPEWEMRIKEVLQDLEAILSLPMARFPALDCSGPLIHLKRILTQRMEDNAWIDTLSEHLLSIEETLLTVREDWTFQMVRKIHLLIHEIRGD
jgi:hypothetical protein